ncbi:sulfite exporter TauE/SafE family protein [Aeromicrobium sp.]|uniref:sulfite exporter TauE/SafE family protein n=1 Tax=Aeromicrobium sp. TaxID=1871063 RepID=UPI003D6A097D
MRNLIVLAVVGLFAQLVDGSLGMAYGVTSSSLLLATGIAPAAASAAVHLSEVGTTLVSGAAHWRFGNIDWRVVSIMAIPGGVFAFLGATLLSSLPGDEAKPWVALLLLSLGVYVVYRFLKLGGRRPSFRGRVKARFLVPLAAVAGTMDAIGGGGWGPVGTTSLLASGRLEPRKVVGSIDTAEFVVAVGASLGFLFALGSSGINLAWAGALLAGGVVAAPVAAYLVRHLPARVLGTAAGGLIIITNVKTVLESSLIGLEKDSTTVWSIVAVLAVAWISLIVTAVQAERTVRRDTEAVPARS